MVFYAAVLRAFRALQAVCRKNDTAHKYMLLGLRRNAQTKSTGEDEDLYQHPPRGQCGVCVCVLFVLEGWALKKVEAG